MNLRKVIKVSQQIVDDTYQSQNSDVRGQNQSEDFSKEIAQIVGHGAFCYKYSSPFQGYVQFSDGTPRRLNCPWYLVDFNKRYILEFDVLHYNDTFWITGRIGGQYNAAPLQEFLDSEYFSTDENSWLNDEKFLQSLNFKDLDSEVIEAEQQFPNNKSQSYDSEIDYDALAEELIAEDEEFYSRAYYHYGHTWLDIPDIKGLNPEELAVAVEAYLDGLFWEASDEQESIEVDEEMAPSCSVEEDDDGIPYIDVSGLPSYFIEFVLGLY